MLKSLLNCDALLWIELKHFLKQVDRVWIFTRLKKFFKILTLSFWQIHHEFLVVFIVNLTDEIHFRVADQVCDHVHKVLFVLSW